MEGGGGGCYKGQLSINQASPPSSRPASTTSIIFDICRQNKERERHTAGKRDRENHNAKFAVLIVSCCEGFDP